MGEASWKKARPPTHEGAWGRQMEGDYHDHHGAMPPQPPPPPLGAAEGRQTQCCSDPAVAPGEEHKVAGAGDKQTLGMACDCRGLDARLWGCWVGTASEGWGQEAR